MALFSRYALVALGFGWLVGCAVPNLDEGSSLDTSTPRPAPKRAAADTPATSGATTVPTAGTPAVAPTTSSPAPVKCPELGVAGAFMCDGFESASLSASWSPVVKAGVVNGFDTKHAASGTHALQTAFAPLPATGRAALSYHAAFAASPKPAAVAMQFKVFLPADGYPTALPLGGFHGASGSLTVSLANSSQLVLTDALEGNSRTHVLGAATLGRWQCVEIEVDATGALEGWLGTTLATSAALTGGASSFASIDAVEVGLTYTEGANPNASVVAWFDDVVVAPAAVGCP